MEDILLSPLSNRREYSFLFSKSGRPVIQPLLVPLNTPLISLQSGQFIEAPLYEIIQLTINVHFLRLQNLDLLFLISLSFN